MQNELRSFKNTELSVIVCPIILYGRYVGEWGLKENSILYIYNSGTHSYWMTGKIMKIDIIEDKITQKGLRIELQVLLDLEA